LEKNEISKFHEECKGKVQKMGVLYIHSLKRPGPFSKLPKKIYKKKGYSLTRLRVAGDHWFLATFGRLTDDRQPFLVGCPKLPPCKKKNSSSCLYIFAHVVNSC
jgi:hypothetical protein